jgi:hypothetical protein
MKVSVEYPGEGLIAEKTGHGDWLISWGGREARARFPDYALVELLGVRPDEAIPLATTIVQQCRLTRSTNTGVARREFEETRPRFSAAPARERDEVADDRAVGDVRNDSAWPIAFARTRSAVIAVPSRKGRSIRVRPPLSVLVRQRVGDEPGLAG